MKKHAHCVDRSGLHTAVAFMCGLFVLTTAFATATAQVDPFAALSEEQAEEAARLLSAANLAYDEERWADAFDAYVGAWAIVPLEDIRFRQAVCLEEIGDDMAALDIYRELQGSERTDVVEAATAAIDVIEARLPTPPQLLVSTDPPGATILIDTEPVGQTGDGETTVEVTAGQHRVELVLEGFEPVYIDVVVGVGQTELISEALTITVEESVSDGRSLALPLTFGGVAVAAVGSGIAFGFLSRSRQDQYNTYDFDQPGANPSALDGIADDAESFALAANISFAAAGVFAVVAVVTYIVGGVSDDEEAAEVSFAPSLSPSVVGGTVGWRF